MAGRAAPLPWYGWGDGKISVDKEARGRMAKARERLEVTPLAGYPVEIGRWLWALEAVRSKTLKVVRGMDQATLDWQGPDGRDNAVGSLLYHIGLVEMSWLFLDVLQREFPAEVQGDFPVDAGSSEAGLTPVLGVPLEVHLGRLTRSRSVFLETMRHMPLDDWRRLRGPGDEDYDVTPEWVVFHLVEHEAGHAYQISSIRHRAPRFLG